MPNEKLPAKAPDPEKAKKTLKNTGDILFYVGWFTIILNFVFYVWGLLDKNYPQDTMPKPDLTGLFLVVLFSAVCIILGNRIRKVADKRMKLYMQVLLGLCAVFAAIVLATGGRIGIMLAIIVGDLIYSIYLLNKLAKIPAFADTLTRPKYLLDKKGWIIFGIVSFLVLIATVSIDLYLAKGARQQSAIDRVNNYLADTGSWKEFNSPVGQFQITLPGYPDHESQTQPVANTDIKMTMDTYTSTDQIGNYYFVAVGTYSRVLENFNVNNGLEGGVNGMVASSEGNELVSSKITAFNGNPAVDFLINNKPNNASIKGRMIMVGQTLYEMMYAFTPETYSESDYNKFIDSFRLK